MVRLCSALAPKAELFMPLTAALRAPNPSAALLFPPPTAPGSGVARTLGKSEKEASTNGMRSKPSRKGDRLIDFFKCGVFMFFIFFFCLAVLLNYINCNPVPRGSPEPSSQGALEQLPHFG